MGHRRQKIIFLFIFTACFYYSHGCTVETANWPLPMTAEILDTFRGNAFDLGTTDIEGINSITYGGALNAGPYVDITHANSRIVISTNNAYENYEENETASVIPTTVTFRCTGGSTLILTFMITVVDTNNNAPAFTPSNEFVFTIATPVPPGFQITGCFNDLTVRDIDLTTQRIDFGIVDNPYFEIEYDAASSTVAKEFKAMLRTRTLIRSIPEPITFTITATDVDLTGDPPITTTATVTIYGDTEFELPEEPVFTETFYLANYTNDNQVVLAEPISLRSGYDELVQFSIDGEFSSHFEPVMNGNQVAIRVVTPLAADVLTETQILLVIKADREYTSGGSATVVVQLPEEVPLEFERAHYEGTIENNNLQVPQLILSQGYEEASVSVIVLNEQSSYFTAVVQGNAITLSMSPLNENVINENSFIYLEVVASTGRSTATTIVTLEIIKDDNVTPVFSKSIYEGSYDTSTGLTVEQILLIQGYDDTSVILLGDYASYFEVINNGPVVTIYALTIPPEIFSEGRILLSLEANKPRTVGAHAAVSITLPAARELEFEASIYRGSFQDEVLALEPIRLTVGYDENIIFSVTGDYASYFSVSNLQNQVSINLVAPIPSSILSENDNIYLTLGASGLNAVRTTTSVLLDIIKDDTITPVFTRNIYYGTYMGPSNINIENINLAQGYESGVTFRLEGEHSAYFEISDTDNGNVALFLRSAIPEDVIFNEKVLLFSILAEKAFTVGARAAIAVRFPPELTESAIMRFSQNTYTGSIESNTLTVDNIILSTGHATGTEFYLIGDYSTYFTLTDTNNMAILTLSNPFPIDSIKDTFIVLEIEARRERAVSVWTSVVIDIIKQENVSPIFTEAYYRGVFNADSELQFNDVISLLVGYDETVDFDLEGEFAPLFSLIQRDSNSLSIIATSPISDEVLASNSHLLFTVVAYKPNAITARATISIDIEKVIIETVVLQFTQNNYVGIIVDGQLQVPTITLEGNTEDVSLSIIGDFSQYFAISGTANNIEIQLTTELPTNVIAENPFIVLEVVASHTQAISGYTTVVIEIMKQQPLIPVFDRGYYAGEYSEEGGLQMGNTIHLIHGFDESVYFVLEGDDAQWFRIVENGENNLSISVIDSGILAESRSHFVFSVAAYKPDSFTSRAAIVISVTDFTTVSSLQFSQDYYTGSIDGNSLTLATMSLLGYSDDVAYDLTGDYANYFQIVNEDGVFTLQLLSQLPSEIIAANDILIFTLEAQRANTRTHTTIVLEMVKNTGNDIDFAFEEIYYVGSYSEEVGLMFDAEIRLSEDFNMPVSYSLQGAQAQWFGLTQTGNTISLTLTSLIPSAVLQNNQQLIFTITADSPGLTSTTATIIISIEKEYVTDGANLGFDRVTYLGSIQNNALNIGPITLIEGHSDDVTLALYGDLSSYFYPVRQGSVITIALLTPIPAQLMPENRLIIIEIQASASQANTASATIVVEIIVEGDDSSGVQLVFAAPYYTGSYSTDEALVFETPVSLAEGYDDSVQFALEGEHAQWFSPVRVGNSVTLVVTSAIPAAVLTNNRQLVFVVTAQRPGSAMARATIVITLTDEYITEGANLGFDRVTYLGSIQNNALNIGPITLIEGHSDDVTLALYGDLSGYFYPVRQGSVITIALLTPIPAQLMPENRLIIIEIQASASQANTASATIVVEVIVEGDDSSGVQLVFAAPYYTGSYSTDEALVFETPVSLAEGYDDSVQFALEGEHAQWFSPVRVGNSVTLVVTSAIPAAVLTNNRQLVFVVTAQRPGSAMARATIFITLTDEYITEGANLGFDRVTYLGSIQNNALNIGPITLIEGHSDDVTLALYGDLSGYFYPVRQGSVITIALLTPIPAQLMPENRLIIIEIQASASQANTASATIVVEVIVEGDDSSGVQLVFAAPYYTGSYSTDEALVFETPVSLAEGYDDSVQFALEGEHAQWFSPVRVGNSVTLVVTSAIPAAVLTNNRQLVFVVTAQRPGSAMARATIVITLTDEYITEGANLGFDRVTYLGSIQNNALNIGPITLIEGHSDDVTLALYGDLSGYFYPVRQGSVITIALLTPIPAQLMPENRLIIIEIQASASQANTASATIVVEVIVEGDDSSGVQLVFAAPYYTGSYSTDEALVFETPVSLAEGYDDSVQFALEGEHAQWFSPVRVGNSVTLVVTSAIPAAVLTNNRQLVFVVTAQRPGSAMARATIVITLTDEYITEGANLGFDRVTYLGSIQNNALNIGPITLIEGHSDDVTLALYGDLSGYFYPVRQGSVITIALLTPIPAQLMPENRLIIIEIQASASQANTASATIVVEVIVEGDDSSGVQLVFAAPYYTGSYSTDEALVFETPVSLAEGYDDSVQFALEGEHAQWFSPVRVGNSVTLVVTSAIPAAVLTNNRQLVFVVTAQRPGSAMARATIVITLTDEYITEGANLGFDRVTYLGSIQNNALNIGPITLIEGHSDDVTLALYGDLSGYFYPVRQGSVITIALLTPIPAQLMPENRLIIIEIQASASQANTASATIVVEVIVEGDDSSGVQLVFAAPYYTGSYSTDEALVFETPVSLAEGYDDSVQFALEGEHAQWFSPVRVGNSVTLVVTSAIPAAVLTNNRQLVFVVTAQRPGSAMARATIVITLTDEYITEGANLGFDRVTYLGSIQNNALNIGPITLIEGHSDDVTLALYGDLSGYFYPVRQGSVITIALLTPIPAQLMPENRLIIIEIQASASQANTASATIVVEVIVEGDDSSGVQLVFAAPYYTGSYSTDEALVFETPVSLAEGYDDSVQFALEGEHAQWFSPVRVGNSVTLVVTSAIPAAVLTNNRQLVFVVTAQRPGSAMARATIVITLTDEYITEGANLGFDRVTYLGSIQNNALNIGPITLIEGHSDDVTLALYGDLSGYFYPVRQGSVITIALLTPIPAQLMPENRLIIIEIQASASQANTASATIVVEVIVEGDDSSGVQLVFAAPYYTGSYSTDEALVFETPVSLAEGYDDSVQFALEGEHAQWFSPVRVGNSVTLVVTSAIPAAVLTNNRQLVFVVTAQRPGSAMARATIVITLTDEYITEGANLGFDRVTYLGSIQNNALNIGPITLIEGHSDDVTLALYGDLSGYFYPVRQGSVITIALLTPIPAQLMPENRLIIIEIQASASQANTASATIVVEVIVEGDDSSGVQLVFAAPYYTGSYSTDEALVFETPVSLAEGYDDSVQFALEGEHAQWFSPVRVGNSVTLVVTSAIPAAVLTNNRQLVFVVTAQRPGSAMARATIVITLTDEYITEGANLGFDRVTYLGSIQNNALNIGPITLIEGHSDDVTLALYGDLSSYFYPVRQGSVITIALLTPIPAQLMPENRLIIIEIQASASQANTASATIVVEVIVEGDDSSGVQLVFSAPYYTGSYSTDEALVFETPVSLAEGYDDSVQFALEGEHAQWFSPVRVGNSVTLVVTSAIPAAVLTNNRQLVFVLAAQRPGSTMARAIIVITLTDEYITEGANLGFDRVTYLGSIQNNALNIGPITLIEGHSDDVTLALYGDLSSYFYPVRQGSVITIALLTPIPAQLMPENRLIIIEIQASASQANTASATIVVEVIVEGDDSSGVQLVFAAPYYTGSYSTDEALVFETPVSLAEGYDDSVQFALEGEHAQWFSPVRVGNSVTLVVTSAIPAAVLTNNRQLVFVVTAQRPGSTMARATIVITLTDEYITEGANLGFDRVTYLGSIQNNALNIGPITLIEGHSDDVTLALYGDLSGYFYPVRQGSVITIALLTPIPAQLMPENRLIIIEIQASASQANTASATIVVEVTVEGDDSSGVQLVFAAPYYTGSYSTDEALVFETPVSLAEGYDDSVQFALEGEHAQWFSPVRVGNSVTLVVTSAIPAAVLTNNRQLVFVVTAQRPGSTMARATIVITLTDEYITEGANLGFDRVTYLGSIQNNALNIGPITLIEGHSDDVTLALYGDLSGYFYPVRQGSVITIALLTPIPAQLMPENRLIIIEIQASASQANTASATIVVEVIVEGDDSSGVQLVFAAPYYTGSYSTDEALVFETPVSLAEGYDDSVQFALEGEHAQWFSPVRVGNSVTLVVTSAIPAAVLTNNRQLVFVVTAQRPGSAMARATIVITLTDEYITEGANLGFDRVTYLGSIQNNALNIGPITLIEGHSDDVTLALYGDLSGYFYPVRQGSVITIALLTPIPAQLMPENRLIIIEIQASASQANTASATIVVEVIVEGDDSSGVQLVFAAPYYTGSYSTDEALVFETPVSLAEGYDDSVQFALEGEHAQWFSPVRVGNSVTLVVTSAIPAAVLTNNRQLVFVVTAQRPGSTMARATIVITLTDEYITEGANLGFDRVTYLGSIQNNALNIGPITLIEGHSDDVTLALYGDLSSYFYPVRQGSVITIALLTPIPAQLMPENRLIIIEIQASASQANTASATIVVEVIVEGDDSSGVQLVFAAPYYTGSYSTDEALVFETPVSLAEGYDDSVQFALEGEHAQWFSPVRVGNSVTLVVTSAIPAAVLTNNRQLVFVVTAQRPGSTMARATIVITLTDEYITEGANLGFDRVTYLGSIQNNALNIGPITLIEGHSDDVTLALYGDLSSYFYPVRQGSVITIALLTPIPAQLMPENRLIIIEIQASASQANTASATIVVEVIVEGDDSSGVQLVFAAPYYTGSYSTDEALVFETPVSLAEGYDDSVQFALEGEHAQWFSPVRVGNSVTLVVTSAIPAAVLTNNRQLVFVVTAQRPGSTMARATIVITLTDEYITEGANLGFDRVTYLGSIQNNALNIGPITLIEGHSDDVTLALYGDLSSYFYPVRQGSVITIALLTPIPAQLMPENRLIIIEIQASASQANTASATIVVEVIVEGDDSSGVQLVFAAPYYTGSYSTDEALVFETPVSLAEGYDDSVQFALEGEHAQWFSPVRVGNSVTLVVTSAIPAAVLTNNRQLVFVVTAQRPGSAMARATIVITLTDDLQTGDDVSFSRVLYEGIVQFDEVQHEAILISGYDGSNVELFGEYSTLFVANVADGVVLVQAAGSLTLPADVTRLALELHAAGARAVLLLNVLQADVPVRPSVTFSSESYVLNVEVVQTGLVGRVSATADNGEAVTYSLEIDNAHLQSRLSVNNDGELYLSAPANSGVYAFQVIATTIITQATGTATIYLTVETVTVCGDDTGIVVPPLIILDRDEEEPHNNLVVLDSTHGCHFSLTNRWPVNQTWLYVDENGLHATAIDREHESIAFMALSQVQVELILHCENDNAIRTKRSDRTDWLGPYDYGANKWILTETIQYNSRRSFVNLIVNDINDNAPIFVGKELEPIAVGYPIDELEERILPRSLAELKATDADIGENAALSYWSSESVLAVSPSTGFVHVRSGARLYENQLLTVSATDRNGEGLSGSIQLVVKLLDLNNLVVVTVRGAFLDDEDNVLSQLSEAVGYEVKSLRSVVISDDAENVARNAAETSIIGASLQLYVYGLVEREPVAVDRLAADINNNAEIMSIASAVSLEDHLEDSVITILERDVGLLVATIVLSILLFILLLLIAIWFFLRWRKNRNYDEFSDENSLGSINGSLGDLAKPEGSKPRLNIEDLKKSERRLQKMLNAPIEEITVDPMTSRKDTTLKSILDFPMPEPNAPIVIQSIDKLKDGEQSEDEYGETLGPRRKSVVTFNENVEKIIHVEDETDESTHSGYEIYKL